MTKYIQLPLFLSFFLLPFFVIANEQKLLSNDKRELFSNPNKISIKGHNSRFGRLQVELVDFHGIYRVGADLIQNTVQKHQKYESVACGIIDSGFDLKQGFLRGRIKQTEPFSEVPFSEVPYCGPGFHGTHVLGTLCAREYGVAGNCPLTIWLVDGKGHTIYSGLAYRQKELDFLCDKKVRFVSRSMGPSGRFEKRKVVNLITEFTSKSGAIFVNSAGNSGIEVNASDFESLENNNLLFVANVDPMNFLCKTSNFGKVIFIGAPGVDIYSASGGIIIQRDGTQSQSDNLELLTGTSMAAPHVSGTIAAMLAINPALSNWEVLEILKVTANNRFGKQKTPRYGYGVLNTYGAVKLAQYFSTGDDFDSSLQKLKSGSEKYLNRALDILEKAHGKIEISALQKAEKWFRKAYFCDTENIKALHALFLFQKHFGYKEESYALAIDLLFKTRDIMFLKDLPLEKKYLLKSELIKIQIHLDTYDDLLSLVNNDVVECENICQEALFHAQNSDFEFAYLHLNELSITCIKSLAEEAIKGKNAAALKNILDAKTQYDYPNKIDKFDIVSDLLPKAMTDFSSVTLNILLARVRENQLENCRKYILKQVVARDDGDIILKEISESEFFNINNLPLPINPSCYKRNVLNFILRKNIPVDASFLSNIYSAIIFSNHFMWYRQLVLEFIDNDYNDLSEALKSDILLAAAARKNIILVSKLCEKTSVQVMQNICENLPPSNNIAKDKLEEAIRIQNERDVLRVAP